MRIKLWKYITLTLVAIILLASCSSNEDTDTNDEYQEYPEQDINGIIMWGEGGATDIIGRDLAPIVEENLDGSLVMQNKEGAGGATATQYVHDQPADGYSLLFGAENPNLYQVLGVSDRSYQDDFIPINVVASSYGGIIVKEDSPYETIEDLIEDAQDNPGDLVFGTTGEGGLPTVVLAMLESELGTDFKTVPYDGEGPVSTALLGDEVDATAVTVSAAQEYVESGDFRMLSVVNDESIESFSDVPPITDSYPEIEKYLPWGPFQAVFASKDTPDAIVKKLSESFHDAVATEESKETLEDLGMEYMNISGEEAEDYIDQNRSTAAWMLYEVGETEESPEDFDIPKPK